jgi:hypothetical protein
MITVYYYINKQINILTCNLIARVQCSKTEEKNNYLMKRTRSPTCELKPSAQNSILDIQRQVRSLKNAVDEILKLLRKPQNGELMDIIIDYQLEHVAKFSFCSFVRQYVCFVFLYLCLIVMFALILK